MARQRKGRDLHGVLLLDKPSGISSNDALQKVKRLFQAKKAGHTGALDPLATGMLPICFGEATKFSQYLLDSDKRYRVIARLGQRTDTSDSDGQIIAEREVNITQVQLDSALATFCGTTQQTPSMYSALKYQGRPLYEYARQGIDVPRPTREITVYELQLVRWQAHELELEIHCSKGTYIRTIIDDLGELLGCGAHVIMLRRLQVSHYPSSKMVTLEALQAMAPEPPLSLLLPMDSPVQDYVKVELDQQQTQAILQGRSIAMSINHLQDEQLVRVYANATQFLGMAKYQAGQLAPKRLVVQQEHHPFDNN